MDNRPLYVQRLDRERRQAQVELEELRRGLMELRRYLTSPKFLLPSPRQRLVNTDDVLMRLSEADSNAVMHAECELAADLPGGYGTTAELARQV